MAFYLVCFSCAWDPGPGIVLTALKSFGFQRPVFCPHEKGEIILAKGLLLKKAKHLAGRGLLEAAELLGSLSPVFNSSRSASPWAPGTEGHCDNPSLSFGVDQERRNSMGSVVPRAHPPPPIVHRTWSRMHIAHFEVTMPSPSRLHSEQIKRHWLPQLPSGESIHRAPGTDRMWTLGRWPGYLGFRQFWLRQPGWHHTHCPRQPYISRSYLLLSHPGLSEQPRNGLSEKSSYVLGPGHILSPAFILRACHSKCLLAPKPTGYISFLLYLNCSHPVWFVGPIPLPTPHPQTPASTKP